MEATYVLGEPAYLSIPEGRRGSYGDIVGEVAEMMHRPLDPHQMLAVDAINSYGPGGRWLAMESCVVGPRQVTGKTGGILLPSQIANVLTWREPGQAVWSSHRTRAMMQTVKDLDQIIEGSEEFSKRVKRFNKKDDDAELMFLNGSSILLMTRSDGNARALGAEDLVDDEALYMTESLAGDLMPIMASKRNPRIMHGSSAAKAKSTYLQKLMARGRAGGDPGLVYVEYRMPGSWDEPGCSTPDCQHEVGTPGCALDDEDRWLFAAPSVVHGRVQITVVRMLRGAMPPREFGREMGGWEEAPEADGSVSPISAEAWAACRVRVDEGEDPAIVGSPVLALDVSPDRSSAAIGLAGRRADRAVQVEVVAHRSGEAWVLGEFRKAHASGMTDVALDGKSQAATFRADLEALGFVVHELGAADQVDACTGLQRDVLSGDRLRHLGDPVLARSLASATVRPVGDGGGWAWARKRSDGDITPTVAVTEARWLFLQVEVQAATVPLVEWGD
jgi:hypothetical protein